MAGLLISISAGGAVFPPPSRLLEMEELILTSESSRTLAPGTQGCEIEIAWPGLRIWSIHEPADRVARWPALFILEGMRIGTYTLDTTREMALRTAAAAPHQPARLETGEVSLEDSLSTNEALTGLRVAAQFPPSFIRIDLAYRALSVADWMRLQLRHSPFGNWGQQIGGGRRLLWQLLAADEARAARLFASSWISAAGPACANLREELSPEQLHLPEILETIAEMAYAAEERELFQSLADETVYERTGGTDNYVFRGTLGVRPAYARLTFADPLMQERFRQQVVDELAAHAQQMTAIDADPRVAAPLRLCGLIVMGSRSGHRVRSDLIPETSRPFLGLVERRIG